MSLGRRSNLQVSSFSLKLFTFFDTKKLASRFVVFTAHYNKYALLLSVVWLKYHFESMPPKSHKVILFMHCNTLPFLTRAILQNSGTMLYVVHLIRLIRDFIKSNIILSVSSNYLKVNKIVNTLILYLYYHVTVIMTTILPIISIFVVKADT